MSSRELSIDTQSCKDKLPGPAVCLFRGKDSEKGEQTIGIGQAGIGQRAVGFRRERSFEIGYALAKVVLRHLILKIPALEVVMICLLVSGAGYDIRGRHCSRGA